MPDDTTATAPAEPARIKLRLAYVGLVRGGDKRDQRRHFYVIVGEDFATAALPDLDDLYHSDRGKVFRSPLRSCRPGAVYELEAVPDGTSVYTSTAKWLGSVRDDLVVAWQLASDAVRDELEAKARERKATKANRALEHLETALAPVKRAARRLNAAERRFLVARVLEILC